MSSKHDRFSITGTWVAEARSGKAFLFHIDDGEGEPSVLKKWLPHSQTKMGEESGRPGDIVTEHTGTMHITIPLWLAENEGIYDLYKDRELDEEYAGDDTQLGMDEREEPEDDDIPF